MIKRLYSILICLLLICQFASADIRLPGLVSDGMVLQHDTKVNIWGWGSPKEKVTVSFLNKTYSAVTDDEGKWKIVLPAMKAGGPYQMTIDGNNHLELKDILIGEVWVCSGQSNMVTPMERVKEKYPNEIAHSKNAFIRQFTLSVKYDFNQPADDVPSGKWQSAEPKSILQFSAVAYFFAKKLYDKYKVPIGLIHSAVGGPPVDAWISEDALKPFPSFIEKLKPFKNSAYVDSINNSANSKFKAWNDNINKYDAGLSGAKPWYDISYQPDDWSEMQIPGYWSDQGLPGVNGVVWLRKEITLPKSAEGKPAKLFLGRIIDADFAYVNGVEVGHITYQYPPRRYEVPAGILKAGKNVITIRVINNNGKGGLAIEKPYYLKIDKDSIDLKGKWQYKLGYSSAPMRGEPINVLYQSTGLYNAMIAPLTNYTIKGVIWYQGEGNVGNPDNYHTMFGTMIRDWRKKWNQGEFPFLFVQLPNFGEAPKEPGTSNWATLREEQAKTLEVSNTAMVVAVDLGEWNDLHPLNKKDVGERLALAARNLAYGETKLIYSGPTYKSSRIEKNQVTIQFSNTGSGLISRNKGQLRGFSIAGEDRDFHWAKARIEGTKVIVWSEQVNQPTAVRYAWADNPQPADLYNKEGLPAAPFRTDDYNKSAVKTGEGKDCIVVLTYDDALDVHLDNVMPVLDSLQLKATFYLSGYSNGLTKRINEWKRAAQNGHELGNHTLFHPCIGGKPGREFVTPDYDLNTYTVNRMINEIRMTNALLKAIDGKTKRTFAYPCGDMKIGDSAYLTSIQNEFTGARGVKYGLVPAEKVNLIDINCYSGNGQTGEQLIEEVKKAMQTQTVLVFLFHGVGGGSSLNVSINAHRQLLEFIKKNESKIWITTMTEVCEYIRDNQVKK